MNSNTKKNYSAYKNNFNAGLFVSSLDRESKQARVASRGIGYRHPGSQAGLDHADSLTAVPIKFDLLVERFDVCDETFILVPL